MSLLSLIAVVALAAPSGPSHLKDRLKGDWALTGMTCKGVAQKLENDYSLSFDGKQGRYLSKNKACTQIEPEIYAYLSGDTVSIKSGVRKCAPSPCSADLAASECGKETNPATPKFQVEFRNEGKTMILSTADPKSVDCIGPGQSKPAVFTFERKAN